MEEHEHNVIRPINPTPQDGPEEYVIDPLEVDRDYFRAFKRAVWAFRLTLTSLLLPVAGFIVPFTISIFYAIYVYATVSGKDGWDAALLVMIPIFGGFGAVIIALATSVPAFFLALTGFIFAVRSRRLARDASPKRVIFSMVASAIVMSISLTLFLLFLFLVVMGLIERLQY